MKCPNLKCKKKGELKTRRTIANGRTVSRERYCPACGQKVDTIEMFVSDHNQNRHSHEAEIRQLKDDLFDKTDRLESLKYNFQAILKECGPGQE